MRVAATADSGQTYGGECISRLHDRGTPPPRPSDVRAPRKHVVLGRGDVRLEVPAGTAGATMTSASAASPRACDYGALQLEPSLNSTSWIAQFPGPETLSSFDGSKSRMMGIPVENLPKASTISASARPPTAKRTWRAVIGLRLTKEISRFL